MRNRKVTQALTKPDSLCHTLVVAGATNLPGRTGRSLHATKGHKHK
jgi:hypothetical protein